MVALKQYKEWSPEVRAAMAARIRADRRAGTAPAHLMRAGPCEICRQPANTMFHAEDYGPTYEAYLASLHAVCGSCHAMLHLRYRFPGRWQAYLAERIADGPAPVVSMSAIYGRSRGWRDVPAPERQRTDAWWDNLS